MNALRRTIPTTFAAAAGFAMAVAAVKLDERKPNARPQRSSFEGDRASDEPYGLQVARATQPDRGRQADAPTRIPARGWKDILWRVFQQITEHRLMLIAAGVVFYGMLAVVPAITAMVSLYGLFAKASTINEHLSFIQGVMPASAYDIIRDQITRIASNNDGKLTFAFIVGLGIALWSANAGVKSIFDALNVVYDEEEKRSFIKLNLVSLAFTLGAVVVLLIAIGAVVVLPLVLSTFGFATQQQTWLVALLRWPALLVVVMLGLALLYRFGPSRKNPQWKWVSVGSVFAAFAWLGVSLAFSWYLSKFADYNATYGSLGAVIGLMMWMWISVLVILIGAELNAEVEHQTARDTTESGHKPLGARGAVMADTVGAAQG